MCLRGWLATDMLSAVQLSWVLAIVAGYLIGSIPFAYLVAKRRDGRDLRAHGSGNVGAMNAYEVTGNKRIGLVVLTLDALKGALPVLWLSLGPADGRTLVLYLVPALIVGHCYPVWLRFRGGRGLATAAGILLAMAPLLLVLWSVLYLIVWKLRPHIHVGAIAASVGSLVVVLAVPAGEIARTALAYTGVDQDPAGLVRALVVVLLVILSRHVGPFLDLRRTARGTGS